MHKTNHPYTKHYCENIYEVNPLDAVAGRPVGWAHFSPDCKHFSKAKGARPVDKHIRGLAWVVLKWAALVSPRIISVENVEEFQTWGPIRHGKPIKSRQGETFKQFVKQLRALGYAVEWRELVAADFGAPTTRRRFFLLARRDGKPIVWPEPTHAPADSPEVRAGTKRPWVSAAQIIDWQRPCPSIFDTKEQIKSKYGVNAVRPLAVNTMKRVARGIDRFVIKSAHPYIVAETCLVGAALVQYHSEKQGEYTRGQELERPLQTLDTSNRYGLAAASLVKYYGQGTGQDVAEPLHTVTAHDREAACIAHVVKFKGKDLGQQPQTPLHTITAYTGEFALCKTSVARYEPNTDLHRWPQVREMLNAYCGYSMAENEVLVLHIAGVDYFISDVGLRMLCPRELYNANGFPQDYIIDRDYTGKEYGKSKQVARCGNAVPPPFAAAIVRANWPERCHGVKIETCAQFMDAVAI